MTSRSQRILTFLILMLLTSNVFAATAPTSGSMLYNIYDIVVLKGIGGAGGYVAGALGIAIGLGRMAYGAPPIQTISTLIGSAAFLAAPTITESLGALY